MPILIAAIISAGSLLQAYVSYFIMKRYSSSTFFSSVKDIFIFLISAGFLTCLIAGTIGVSTLYFSNNLTKELVFPTWYNFCVGDLLGVYIFTPTLVVWSLHRITFVPQKRLSELLLMCLIFAAAIFGTFNEVPSFFAFFPLCIWASYRFHMHGATLAILLVSLATIIPFSLGHQIRDPAQHLNPLVLYVIFLEVFTATFLVFGSVMNERALAHELLNHYGEQLQQTIELLQQKISTLASTTSGLLGQIEESYLTIVNTTKTAIQSFHTLNQDLNKSNANLPQAIQQRIREVDECLNKVVLTESNTSKVLNILQGSLMITNQTRLHSASVNINNVIDTSLQQILNEEKQDSPSFKFLVKKNCDIPTFMIYALQDDLIHAFTHFFRQSLKSMKKKQQLLGTNYEAALVISIEEINGDIKIVIRDNGQGFPEDHLEDMFQTNELSFGVRDLGLTFARDLIVYAHHGAVKVDSRLGEYLQITITIPRIHV